MATFGSFVYGSGTVYGPTPILTSIWAVGNDELLIHNNNQQLYQTDYTAFDAHMDVTSPWYKLAGIQGYSRLYKIFLLGRLDNVTTRGTLNVQIYYDYASSATDSYTYDLTALSTINPLKLEVRPSQQKVESFRLRIRHVDAEGNAAAARLTIAGIGVQFGAQPVNGRRGPSSNRMT